MNFGPFGGNMPDPEKMEKVINDIKDAFAKAAADPRAADAQTLFVELKHGFTEILSAAQNIASKGKEPSMMDILPLMPKIQKLQANMKQIALKAQQDPNIMAVLQDLQADMQEAFDGLGMDLPGMPKGPARKTPPAVPKAPENDNKQTPPKKPRKGGKFDL